MCAFSYSISLTTSHYQKFSQDLGSKMLVFEKCMLAVGEKIGEQKQSQTFHELLS
jgi:hypothetical protein